MKKIVIFSLLVLMSLTLSGCAQVNELLDPPAVNEKKDMTAEEIKEYLGRRSKKLATIYKTATSNQPGAGTLYFLTISENSVSPSGDLTIKQGDSVEWTNSSTVTQKITLTISSSNIITKDIEPNNKFVNIFDQVGEFTFQIDPLGVSSKIIVGMRVEVTTTPSVAPTNNP